MNRFIAVSGAAAVVAAMAGCSSSPKEPPQPAGSLPPGTAQVVIDGNDSGRTVDITCSQVGWSMLITVGNDKSGARAAVETDGRFVPTSVEITDIAGFTGAYWMDTVGDAKATMIGDTYKITGNAKGFTKENPNKDIMKPFELKANC